MLVPSFLNLLRLLADRKRIGLLNAVLERLLELYRKAIELQYRFYSFGDAMVINPDAVLGDARP